VVSAENGADSFDTGTARGLVGFIMILSVKVIPRSKRNSVEWESGAGGEGERLRVRLTAAPVDGAANEALVALLAERLGLPKRQVVVVRGATSRQKVVEVVGLNLEDLKRRLG
jgi:uncharacterized protein